MKCRHLIITFILVSLTPLAHAALSGPETDDTPQLPEQTVIPEATRQKEDRSAAETTPPSRATLLYENHCSGCHESTIHIRNKRKARTRAQIRDWVKSRSEWLKLEWSGKDINDVADYLNRKYYKYNK